MNSSTIEQTKVMDMTMGAFRKLSGLGDYTDTSYNPASSSLGPAGVVGDAVNNVMPSGSYINPQTGQFSQTPPAPSTTATAATTPNYTVYLVVIAGVLVALYFYQKSKGREMFDLAGLAKDFTGGRHKHRTVSVSSEMEGEG